MSTISRVTIINFVKSYPNKDIVIKELHVTQRVTILQGENGSGKSTILKALMNLTQYKGKILNENTCSYMPENPTFPQDITVTEFLVNLVQQNQNDYDYKHLLLKYKLKQKEHEMIHSLSKGMKAKLNLIQCLLRNVDFYLLDEPLSGLDEESVGILVKEIKSSRKSFIISSHLDESFMSIKRQVIDVDKLTSNTV